MDHDRRKGEKADKQKIVVLSDVLSCGDIQEAKRLIEGGYKSNEKDQNGNTALMIAIRQGYEDIARQLLAAHINDKNHCGWTALMYAARFCPTLIKPLLDCGANINARSSSGDTALTLAVHSGLYGVKILVDAGADITVTNQWGSGIVEKVAFCGDEKLKSYVDGLYDLD